MKTVSVSAPGKIILTGEHAVVYGYPGIWATTDKRLLVSIKRTNQKLKIISNHTSIDFAKYSVMKIGKLIGKNVSSLEIKIKSTIPVGSGMGSSAALAVALTGALIKLNDLPWELKRINKIAFEIEKQQHGTPSGGDNTVVTYGGFLKYQKQKNSIPKFDKISSHKKIKNLLIINSGKPQETTGEMVAKVATLYKNNQAQTNKIFSKIGDIAQKLYHHLNMNSKIKTQKLIKENHKLLNKLQVVSPKAQKIIKKIEHIGGVAKISGAGGFLDSSGILLAFHNKPKLLTHLAEFENLNTIPVVLGVQGVRVE